MQVAALFSFLLYTSVYGHKVLVYVHMIAPTHIDVANAYVDALAERGHTVDMMMGKFNPTIDRLPSKSAQNVLFIGNPLKAYTLHKHSLFVERSRNPFAKTMMHYFSLHCAEVCQSILTDPDAINFLRNQTYDLLLMSSYDYCPLALFHKAGITNFAFFTPTTMFFGAFDALGLPLMPSYMIDAASISTSSLKLSFWDRLLNSASIFYFYAVEYSNYVKALDDIVKKEYGETFPSVNDIAKNHSLFFVNVNEFIDVPRPISAKVKYVGGLKSTKSVTELSPEFAAELDKSKKGNIIFSFGTQVSTKNFPLETKRMFIDAFRKFPNYTFYWKYDFDGSEKSLLETVPNIRLMKWIPQALMLKHNKTAAFITHMGLNSYIESSMSGIPTIGIPFIVDQLFNALRAEELGISVVVRKTQITEEAIVDALNKVLFDKKIKQKCVTLASLLADHPQKAREHFVQWVEFAAKHKHFHEYLNLQSAEMTLLQHYNLDLISGPIVIIFILILLYGIVALILRKCIRRVTKKAIKED